MWQFMKPTARSYGLSISLLEDQRKDPILSTIAAARMLRDLYDAYEDWPLALAAYNAGPARVDRALVRTGAHDFWGLCEKKAISKETREFVPRILAATMIEKDPASFGFEIPGEHL
jgi:membrane-bound lytic murein transglycosylase D